MCSVCAIDPQKQGAIVVEANHMDWIYRPRHYWNHNINSAKMSPSTVLTAIIVSNSNKITAKS